MTHVELRMVPTHTPVVLRRCPRCNVRTRFTCADKFRVNGSGRRLDVWLIYKCEACDTTWNCTILSRVTPESIPKDVYQGFMDNDDALAWRYAFDRDVHRKNDAEIDPKVGFRVEGPEVDLATLPAGSTLELAIGFEYPMSHVRLDTFLAQRLGLARRVLDALHAEGKLSIEPKIHDTLEKKLKRPVVVRIDVDTARQRAAELPAREPAGIPGGAEAEAEIDPEPEA